MNEPDQLAPCWHFAWEQAEAALVDDDLSGHSSCSSPSYRAPLGFAPGDWDESPREQLQRIHPDELARVLEAQAALQSPGASLDPLRRDDHLRHRDIQAQRQAETDAWERDLLDGMTGRPVATVESPLPIRLRVALTLTQRGENVEDQIRASDAALQDDAQSGSGRVLLLEEPGA
jgi:hypothetical protein